MAFGSIDLNIQGDTSGLERSIVSGGAAAFKKLAGIASAAFAGITVGNFLKDSITQASNLTESLNAIRVTLGDGADSFLKFGKTAATQLGITQAELNKSIVPMAALLSNAGVSGDALSSQLQTLATRATDVGSVFNTETNVVLEAFGSALRGEQEPIRQFGVNLNEAGIAAKAVELGLAKSTKEVSQAAKTQAALALVLDQTNKNAGDFANTGNQWANMTRKIGATAREAQASIGTALLPTVTDLSNKLLPFIQQAGPALAGFATSAVSAGESVADTFQNRVIPFLQPAIDAFGRLFTTVRDAAPGFQDFAQAAWDMTQPLRDFAVTVIPPLVDGVGQLVSGFAAVGTFLGEHEGAVTAMSAALGGLVAGMVAFRVATLAQAAASVIATAATGGWATAFWALNAALYANPVGLVVAAVAALVAGFVIAWKNSETFREIVVGVFNHVKDAVLTAVGIMFEVFTFFIRGVLNGISGLAGAWTHLPEFLGGGDNGWASKVKGAVDGVLSGLDAIQDGINSLKGRDLVIGIRVTVEEFSAANSDSGFNARAAERATGTGEAIDSAGIALGNALAGIKDKVSKIDTGGGGGSTGGSGGGGGSAGKAAKDAAAAAKKAAAAAAAAALKAGKKQITASKFIDSITGDKAGIDTALDKLYDSLKAANKTKAAAMVKELNKDLTKLAGKRDAVSIKLDNAKDALKEIKNESKSYSASIKQAILDTGNVANNNTITFTGVRNSMRAAVRQAVAFKDAVAALTKAGLNKNNLSQIIDAGPEAGLAAAKAIQQGGKKGITELNALNTQLTAAGTTMGSTTADTFYKAGISAAQGLVNGLQSQEKALQKQMDKLAMGMVKALKKELKIKSPSQVFEGLGNYVGQGLARGVDASRGGVATAGRNLGASVVFGAGSVLVNGVSDPNAARTSGMLVGGAAADSIARSRELAALAGMG